MESWVAWIIVGYTNCCGCMYIIYSIGFGSVLSLLAVDIYIVSNCGLWMQGWSIEPKAEEARVSILGVVCALDVIGCMCM